MNFKFKLSFRAIPALQAAPALNAKAPGNPSAKDSDYFYIQSEIRF